MSNPLDKLTPDERILYKSLKNRSDSKLNDADDAEFTKLLDKMEVNGGGRHRSKQSKKRSATRRRRSSKSRKARKARTTRRR